MVRFYDHKTGKVLASWDAGLRELSAVAFSPDGSRLAVVSNQGNGAKIWDIATRKELLTLNGHTDINWGVEFSPDGTHVITSGSDGTARVWVQQPVKMGRHAYGRRRPVKNYFRLKVSARTMSHLRLMASGS